MMQLDAMRPPPTAPTGAGAPGPDRPARIATHRPGDAQRAEVERFIHGVYARRYGADVPSFAPVLASLQDDSGILAAAGYRDASDGPLFLEHYLDQPIESLLVSMRGGSRSRDGIAEVGHLSAHRAGEGRRLILRLVQHLAEQGYAWVATTATQELLHLFGRMGLTPLMLGTADPQALGDSAHRWGSYYDHRPSVVCGPLSHALQQIRHRGALAGPAS